MSSRSIFYHSSRLFNRSTVAGVGVLDRDEDAHSWLVRTSALLAFVQKGGGRRNRSEVNVELRLIQE